MVVRVMASFVHDKTFSNNRAQRTPQPSGRQAAE
jgi:hypothetical protein